MFAKFRFTRLCALPWTVLPPGEGTGTDFADEAVLNRIVFLQIIIVWVWTVKNDDLYYMVL